MRRDGLDCGKGLASERTLRDKEEAEHYIGRRAQPFFELIGSIEGPCLVKMLPATEAEKSSTRAPSRFWHFPHAIRALA